jgi:hypothetical protein
MKFWCYGSDTQQSCEADINVSEEHAATIFSSDTLVSCQKISRYHQTKDYNMKSHQCEYLMKRMIVSTTYNIVYQGQNKLLGKVVFVHFRST